MFQSESLPLVSIILCVYNGERHLSTAIHDVLSQTYPHFELIISDDASTDKTKLVLEQYHDDPRVRIFTQPRNLGVVSNKNFAIAQARGDYITQQDHDDRTDRTRIERQISEIFKTKTLVAACGVRRLDAAGVEISRYSSTHDMVMDVLPKSGLPFFFAPIMFHRAVWQQHGPFNRYFNRTFGEDKYFISCVLRSHQIAVISDCLYDYFDRPSSATSCIRNSRALVMMPILAHLEKQNLEIGFNDLEIGNIGGLLKLEKKITSNRPFMANQYRTYAARAIDHGQFKEAIRLLIKSISTYPFSMNSARTAVYLIRRIATRSK